MADGGGGVGVVILEDWATILVAGDQHVVGRAGARWIVTGALREPIDGVVRTQWGGGTYRLGRQATALCPQAIAAVRSTLSDMCLDPPYVDRVLKAAQSALQGA